MTAPDDYDAAKQNYQMAVDIDPNLAEAHYYLGKLMAGGRRVNEDGTSVVEFHEKRMTRTRVMPGGADPRLSKTMIDLWKRRADLLGLDSSKTLNLDVDTVAFKVDPGHPTWEAPTRSVEDEARIAALLDDVPDTAKKKLKFHFVAEMHEVLALTLGIKV